MEEWPLRVHESRQSSPGMQSLSPNLKEGENLDKDWKKKTHVAATFEPEVLAAFPPPLLFMLLYLAPLSKNVIIQFMTSSLSTPFSWEPASFGQDPVNRTFLSKTQI